MVGALPLVAAMILGALDAHMNWGYSNWQFWALLVVVTLLGVFADLSTKKERY